LGLRFVIPSLTGAITTLGASTPPLAATTATAFVISTPGVTGFWLLLNHWLLFDLWLTLEQGFDFAPKTTGNFFTGNCRQFCLSLGRFFFRATGRGRRAGGDVLHRRLRNNRHG